MPRATARRRWSAPWWPTTISPDRRSGARDRDGGCTAIEEIDDRCIPQDQRIEPAVILVALEGTDWRRCDRDRRPQQGIEPRGSRSHARDQVGPGSLQADVLSSAHAAGPLEALWPALVRSGAAPSQKRLVPTIRPTGREAGL